GDQQCVSIRIEFSAFKTPPAVNRSHRESSRVMVRAHIYKSSVPAHVIDAVRTSPMHLRTRKVVALHRLRLFGSKPLLASIGVVVHQSLFLGVHRNDGPTCR